MRYYDDNELYCVDYCVSCTKVKNIGDDDTMYHNY
jgi:hypothetical protein